MFEKLLRKLAEFEPAEVPVLSIYLDMRPQATGGNPAVRSGEIVLKDALHKIKKSLEPRAPGLESFRRDRGKITGFLEDEFSSDTYGLAIFACAEKGLFETIEVRKPFENQVEHDSVPELFQLVKLIDEHHSSLITLVDSRTARLIVNQFGRLREIETIKDETPEPNFTNEDNFYNRPKEQDKIEQNRRDFAKDIAEKLDELIKQEDAKLLIMAGDEVAVPLLKDELSERAESILYDKVLAIDIRASLEAVDGEVRGILQDAEAFKSHDIAEKLIGEVGRRGLGVSGLEKTRKALEMGQVDTLVLDPGKEMARDIRNQLIRQAVTTDAKVELVDNHAEFSAAGGVGALLRYKVQTKEQ